jgi:hypothetical protein
MVAAQKFWSSDPIFAVLMAALEDPVGVGYMKEEAGNEIGPGTGRCQVLSDAGRLLLIF